jgi:hypothetical protein
VVAVLAGVVALVGGTAYAAGAGRLPDPVQRQLHEALAGVGVPPPATRGVPSPGSKPASAPAPTATSPGDTRLLALCRAWQATRTTPGAPQLRPDEQRVLADAAGTTARIEQFCAALAGPTASGSATPAAPAKPGTPTPGKPGNPNPGGPPATPPGHGNGKGNGPPR